MAKVENKCTNCKFQDICLTSANNQIIVWTRCPKFKPTLEAIAEAREREAKARRKRTAAYFDV